MTKLNDTQRTILAAAAARDSGLVLPLPKSLKLGVAKATPIIALMVETGLILERAATEGETVWRSDELLGKRTVVVTADGLRAVGIEPTNPEASAPSAPNPRRKDSSKPTAMRSTAKPAKEGSGKNVGALPAAVSSAPKRGTKLALLIATLRSKKGATIGDLTTATGWQPHSVRGAISGALKKKQGLNVTSTPVDGRGRVYRIAE